MLKKIKYFIKYSKNKKLVARLKKLLELKTLKKLKNKRNKLKVMRKRLKRINWNLPKFFWRPAWWRRFYTRWWKKRKKFWTRQKKYQVVWQFNKFFNKKKRKTIDYRFTKLEDRYLQKFIFKKFLNRVITKKRKFYNKSLSHVLNFNKLESTPNSIVHVLTYFYCIKNMKQAKRIINNGWVRVNGFKCFNSNYVVKSEDILTINTKVWNRFYWLYRPFHLKTKSYKTFKNFLVFKKIHSFAFFNKNVNPLARLLYIKGKNLKKFNN